jgi:4-amino-4-deoxy-L-arabinose transferase-like glycosyltransferase
MGSGRDRWNWQRFGLAGILVLATALRLWRLVEPGYGNAYYAASVRSMMLNPRNFLFGAFDPAGFVSVDKPPVAFWLQTTSAWLFGFSGWSLRLPQALGGVVAVALVYHLVRRSWGAGAGLLAALTLAVTPIAVAVDRINSTDAPLVLALMVAAWPLCRAAETGRLAPLALSLAVVGVAFNVKMLAAYVVLPAFVLVYLVTAPVAWRTRIVRLAAASAVLLAVSLSWSVAVDLTPPSRRPYVGDSQNNTELDLILGYNGVARLMAGTRWARRGNWIGNGPPRVAPPDAGNPAASSAMAGPGPDDRTAGPATGGTDAPPLDLARARAGRARFTGGPPGPLRLAAGALAGDVAWLFPLAGLGLLAALVEPRRRSLRGPRRQAALFWGLWLACGTIVFSFAEGMFRPYYVVLLAPALAALVGIGVTALWQCYRERGWASVLLPAALLLTAVWQGYVLREYRDWGPALTAIAVGGGVVAALGLILARFWNAESAVSHGARIALATGLIALLTSPVAWAATPALVGGGAGVPAVGPDLLNRGRWGAGFAPGVGAPDVSRLVDFLRAHRQGERYFLATVNAMQAAPIIIQTGEPVMAIGGWSGRDPILSVDRFAALVADGQVRYVLVPDLASRGGAAGAGFGGREMLTDGRNAELFRWVIEHGRPVDPALWRSDRQSEETDTSGARPIGPRGPRGGGFGQPNLTGRQGWRGGLGRAQQLYDCRPGVAASTADAPSDS